MARVFKDDIVVSVDVGTTKICVIIAKRLGNGDVDLLGIGTVPSIGLKKGVVVDINKAVTSIRKAIREAEVMAGTMVEQAYVGIAGGHISSLNSQGIVPIKNGEVSQKDINTVISAAQAVPIPEDQQILHVLPQYFIVDSRDRVQNPLGMHGVRLEAQVHIVVGSVASVQDLVKCCQLAGIKVKDIVLEQLASAEAVLSYDERELGVAVLDIGGGTSDLALYYSGTIRHTRVIPVAGNHFTNDLAVGLHTTINGAERVKQRYGNLFVSPSDIGKQIQVEHVQGNRYQDVALKQVQDILKARAKELLGIVQKEIVQYNLEHFVTSGLVLTGGGSLLDGFRQLASESFGMPARIGYPKSEDQLPELLESPLYATGYGLLLHAMKKEKNNMINNLQGPMTYRVFMRMKSWVSDFF
ncbi:cell division protein FtsA [bacterium]|jgi:cell division protein FtsA|nr:cell division protein FtsA [bacterium]